MKTDSNLKETDTGVSVKLYYTPEDLAEFAAAEDVVAADVLLLVSSLCAGGDSEACGLGGLACLDDRE